MARRCWALPLCVVFLACSPARAVDDSKDLAALLSRADVASRGFRGEFETFRGEDQPNAPLDFRTDDLRPEFRGRLWVKGEDALVEFLGGPGMEPSGRDARDKSREIIQVLAASKDATFDFTALPRQNATLKIYNPDQPEWVRNRIDSQILDPLNAFSFAKTLINDEAVVRADPAKGQYSITAKYNDARNPSIVICDLAITDQTASISSKLAVGPPASVITIETLAEGDVQDGAIIPRRVVKRISAPGSGDVGPEWRDVTREVALFTPKDFEPAPFPITADFFKKYEKPYSVIQGDARQSNGFANAGRFTVVALVGLFTALWLVLRLLSRASRSTSKKPEEPFGDLL